MHTKLSRHRFELRPVPNRKFKCVSLPGANGRTMRILLTAVFVLVTISAQQLTTASLEGFVVRAGTIEPVPKASVELRSGSFTTLVTTADSEGRFFFPKVLPGDYQ